MERGVEQRRYPPTFFWSSLFLGSPLRASRSSQPVRGVAPGVPTYTAQLPVVRAPNVADVQCYCSPQHARRGEVREIGSGETSIMGKGWMGCEGLTV